MSLSGLPRCGILARSVFFLPGEGNRDQMKRLCRVQGSRVLGVGALQTGSGLMEFPSVLAQNFWLASETTLIFGSGLIGRLV